MLRDTFDVFPFLDDTLSFFYSPDHPVLLTRLVVLCRTVLCCTYSENPISDPLFLRSLQWQFSSVRPLNSSTPVFH